MTTDDMMTKPGRERRLARIEREVAVSRSFIVHPVDTRWLIAELRRAREALREIVEHDGDCHCQGIGKERPGAIALRGLGEETP